MIITRTPFRISFAGGGSDLKEYYLKYGGSVLSTSIDKYVYLTMHPYFHDDKYFLKYSNIEETDNVEAIKHKILKQVFKNYKIKGIDFSSSADIPSGTGLGSSSAFTSGLITLCNAYTEKYMAKDDIAKHACDIEINQLKEPIGKQDQYACSIGGLNFIKFNSDDTVSIEKILMKKEYVNKLESNLLMFYLGSTRSASSILAEQKLNTSNKLKIENLHKIVKLSEELKIEFQNSNIDAIGDILHRGWIYKKELASQISNKKVNYYYDIAIKNGATGGKLLGAGGSGFLLFYVPLLQQNNVRKALIELDELNFTFDNEGTKVIYYNEG
jgi:D-glycero-alpha-D-manno-heptose-7-phosphate kinase